MRRSASPACCTGVLAAAVDGVERGCDDVEVELDVAREGVEGLERPEGVEELEAWVDDDAYLRGQSLSLWSYNGLSQHLTELYLIELL